MAAHIEFKNPFKWTPGTIENAKYNTMPLITNENNPRVKNVIGNEKNWITGLTIRLRQPKIRKQKSKIPNLVSILRLLILMAVPEIPVFIRAATLKRQIRLPGPT